MLLVVEEQPQQEHQEQDPLVEKSVNVDHATKGLKWVLLSVCGGLIYGYNVSLAPQLPLIATDLRVDTTQQEILNAAAIVTDAISMLFGGYLAYSIGRKKMALYGTMCTMLGTITSMGATTFVILLVCRMVTGIGNGLALLLILMYIGENVAISERGALVASFQFGVLLGSSCPYLVLTVAPDWRSCCAVGAIPAILAFCLFVTCFPESHSWLHMKQSPRAMMRIRTGMDSSRRNTTTSTKRTRNMTGPPHVLVGIVLAFANNAIDPCLFYGPEIFMAMGNSTQDGIYLGLCSSVLSCVAIMTSIALMPTYSRRAMYMTTLCYVLVALPFWGLPQGMGQSLLVVVLFAGLVAVFQCGPGALFLVIVNELFSQSDVRGSLVSVCTFFTSFFSLLINGTMLTLFDTVGAGSTFAAYGGAFFACWLFFWRYLPETKFNTIASSDGLIN